jgi:hypothetical protein
VEAGRSTNRSEVELGREEQERQREGKSEGKSSGGYI